MLWSNADTCIILNRKDIKRTWVRDGNEWLLVKAERKRGRDMGVNSKSACFMFDLTEYGTAYYSGNEQNPHLCVWDSADLSEHQNYWTPCFQEKCGHSRHFLQFAFCLIKLMMSNDKKYYCMHVRMRLDMYKQAPLKNVIHKKKKKKKHL